uniref:Uncharacterized protein n=1 Tax=Anguilla anguilla TaxID=7936 RepID=A0A0E9SU59_ANGAN
MEVMQGNIKAILSVLSFDGSFYSNYKYYLRASDSSDYIPNLGT